MLWKDRSRDLFGYFERELQGWRGRVEEARPKLWRGELIKGKVATNGRKGLGVLAEALLLETLTRIAAATQYRSGE